MLNFSKSFFKSSKTLWEILKKKITIIAKKCSLI